jgi:hypothetical protein
MMTLQYETWEQLGEKIILKGKSIGNLQTISISDALDIRKLASNTLALRRGNFEIVYPRSDQDQ